MANPSMIETADTMQFLLGTPPVSFEMLMDSGSADTWVGSTDCHSQAGGDCVRICALLP